MPTYNDSNNDLIFVRQTDWHQLWRHGVIHYDVIKWKHFPRYWPFVRGIRQSPVDSTHKGQWCGALMFSLICAWTNGWVNNVIQLDILIFYRAARATTLQILIAATSQEFGNRSNTFILTFPGQWCQSDRLEPVTYCFWIISKTGSNSTGPNLSGKIWILSKGSQTTAYE